ncbi:MAG TPA: ThuA domain-containing protein [Tepidisphaeraceae bacterium]|jgi:type 1 glutamine amidotransferase|nr:ThuA domain-containing protein [Tepidisphaeraceae bacterium]
MRPVLCAVVAAVVLALATVVHAQDKINVLIVTGDHAYHPWKETTPFLKDLLTKAGMNVQVTETPAKDLTPENLSKFNVIVLNYKESQKPPADTKWSDANKKAFADAINGGAGLVVYHFAAAAFVSGDPWDKEYEKIIAGGWRKQGFHGQRHVYDISMTKVEHPITKGMPRTFTHSNDELYQNSLIIEGSQILATAYSDKSKDPKNTGKDEPMLWINQYGKGRVVNEAMGHDVRAMQDLGFQTLFVRSVEWAAIGEVRTKVPDELVSNAPKADASEKK